MMKGQTILVVDDEEKVLAALKDILESEGYTVRVARNGVSALRQVDSDPPELVITDINMPDMEGIEFIQKLAGRTDKIPIIAISGDPLGSKFLKAARLLGAVDSLQKPFSIADIREKVTAALSNARRFTDHGKKGSTGDSRRVGNTAS
jgi:DNA-binding NtrC family response regulator